METFEELLKANTRYIEIIANQYGQDGDTVKDLEQVGRIGLWTAFNKYDPTKEIPFMKFAVWYIKKEMMKFLDENARTIRIPANQLYNKEFISTTRTISLDTPINDDTGTLHDVIGSEVSEEGKDFTSLYTTLESLKKDSHREMVKMKFGFAPYNEPHTNEDIAQEYGCTRENVRQIITKVLKKLENDKRLHSAYKSATQTN